jgi:phage baseplate assembly protein W
MANINKTLSVNFPFNDETINGKFLRMNTTSIDDLRSSLFFFITTQKGERWYDPNFGTKLHEFLFEKNDNLVAAEIRESLKTDIENYFSNVTIDDINIDQSESVNKLIINITFTLVNSFTTIQDNISINFG